MAIHFCAFIIGTMAEITKIDALAMAAQISTEIRRLTLHMPPDEDFMMVPILRDEAFGLIENLAMGSAGYHPVDRFRFYVRARKNLDQLNAKLVVCRATGLLCRADTATIDAKSKTLKQYMDSMIIALKNEIQKMPFL
jgi:hypothetical protein